MYRHVCIHTFLPLMHVRKVSNRYLIWCYCVWATVCICVCVCVTMCVSKLDPSNHEGQCLAPLCTALVQWGESLHSLAAVKQQRGWGVWGETGSRLSVQQYFSICPQIVIFSISIKSMFPWQPTHFLSGWIVFHTVATLLWYVLLSLILFFWCFFV